MSDAAAMYPRPQRSTIVFMDAPVVIASDRCRSTSAHSASLHALTLREHVYVMCNCTAHGGKAIYAMTADIRVDENGLILKEDS